MRYLLVIWHFICQPDLAAIPVEGLAPIAFGVRVRRGRRPALVNAFVKALADGLASS